nr:uncharacterized protein LOC133586125 [Nerophis lumbriciformis]
MSIKRKKSGLMINWQKSFSILAPWRRGKGDRDTVLDSAVVLTKMKLFRNFNERLFEEGTFPPTLSAASEEKDSHHSKEPFVESQIVDKSAQLQAYTSTDYLSDMFSDSQLTRLYKFESEDSGVELSSGHSPSTPTGSDHNFVVHSRESSCDSSNLNMDPTTESDEQTRHKQNCDISKAKLEISSSVSRNELNICEDLEMDECSMSPIIPATDEENLEKTGKFEHGKEVSLETSNNKAENDFETSQESSTCDNFVKYMNTCCILNETHQSSCNPLGSGLGYLEHICQLIEKIGQLQENNLRLQRHICRLQKDGRMTKTKEIGDYDTWDRVKHLVKRTNVRNKSKLGLVRTPLKMSCPQLYSLQNLTKITINPPIDWAAHYSAMRHFYSELQMLIDSVE